MTNRSTRLRSLGRRALTGPGRRLRIDTRALAVFRVGLGLLLLADLALRARDLRAFYTDAGVLPRSALVAHGDPLHWSLHAASGDPRVQALLFLVAAVLAVALTVGYRTTVATVGSWLLLVSLHNRMPEVLNGGDVLLRLLLFWGMFLPLGARWAVDSAHAARDPRESVTGVAAAALLLQVVAMYATNGAFKLGGDLWLRGVGLEYVFSLGQFTVLLGDHLAAYPGLLRVLDYLWLAAITASVLLVLLTGLWRAAFAGLLMTMHLGMLVTMRIHLFPLTSVVALVPFLPAALWDRLLAALAGRRSVAVGHRWTRHLAGALPVVTVSEVPTRLERWKGRLLAVVPLVFLVLVVLWNLQVLGVGEVTGREVLPEAAEPALDITRTDQYWNMFAPDPLATDGWLVAPGRLENGSQVDAFHGGAVEWDRPPDISSTYPTARWRKYVVGLWRADTADREQFAAYLCRRWNDRHDTELERVAVYYVEQPTRIDAAREPTERVRLEAHAC
jgi:hypothetical protein